MIRRVPSFTAFLLIPLVFTLSATGPLALSQVLQDNKPVLPSSLRWYAEIAKAHGQSSVDLASTETHDYSPSLTESLRKDVLVKGIVVSQTLDWSDGFKIFRWYRVRVLSHGPDRAFTNTLEHASIPNSAKNIGSDEILIRVHGGTAVIDGVAISQPGPLALKDGQQYAFFVNKTSFGFYTLGFETTPVAINSAGSFDFSSSGNKLFTRQLRAYHSFEDVQQLAMRTK